MNGLGGSSPPPPPPPMGLQMSKIDVWGIRDQEVFAPKWSFVASANAESDTQRVRLGV